MTDVTKTLEQRGEEYGEAWLVAGTIMTHLQTVRLIEGILSTPYAHNWVLILSKLIRACRSPNNPDHWRDIAGYATLVLERIQRKEQQCTE